MKRAACDAWPTILNPRLGCLPPADFRPRGPERVLHIAIRNGVSRQEGLMRALCLLGEYREVDWRMFRNPTDRGVAMLKLALDFKPTLIFMQLERGATGISPQIVEEARALADPSCVIINWRGDQFYNPRHDQSRWFVELGHVCDASLMANTSEQIEYLGLGVRHPGYFNAAIDPRLWKPSPPTEGTPPYVMLCNRHNTDGGGYIRRMGMLRAMAVQYDRDFCVYGNAWEKDSLPWKPALPNEAEAGVYAAAQASLSISLHNDIPRYTSDRLFRMLASGAVCVVERFPDMEGLGLVDGVHCMTFDDTCDLIDCLSDLRNPDDLRRAAANLALEYHTWEARMPELRAIVYAVRDARRAA